jgi:hypothetical protein
MDEKPPMPPPIVKIWKAEDGIAPDVQALLGKKILRAWMLPSNRVLILLLDDNHVVEFETTKTDMRDHPYALQVRVSVANPGANFKIMDVLTEQTPRLIRLRGLTLTNIDGLRLEFNDLYGAMIFPDRVEWVKKRA